MDKEVGWTEKVAKDWKRYKPPSRPSRGEIKIYESYISSLRPGSSVLILGSTPELRELAAKYRMNVTVCDWSEEIFEALKLLMKHKNSKEIFSKQDWRQMGFSEKFDMIAGDCATTVVPFGDLDKVLENIASQLKPGGIAVQRIWVRYRTKNYSLPYIQRLLRKKPKHMHWYKLLLFPVFFHYYDADNERLSGEELYRKISNDVEGGRIGKRLADLFSLVKDHKTPNNTLEKTVFEAMLEKYFRILKRNYSKESFSRYAPIYALRLRLK